MKNNIQFLTSDLLTKTGVRHGWFMRYGGVSKELFESLNGKKGIGDPDKNVEENRKRAAEALGANSSGIAHIIHAFEDQILSVESTGEYNGFDAVITETLGLVLSQTTADCASVIITNQSGSIVALVHGSWHTLKERIICDVVAKIKTHTSQDLVAGIGPMICKNCYEYGPEAAEMFNSKYLEKSGKKYLLDLKQIVIDQLQECGVDKIDDLNICTLEDERFFSHRKYGAQSGRFLTLATITDVV